MTKLIAEIAMSHEGSLGFCFASIENAARSGADYVKFQMHFAEEESTLDENFRVQMSKQDANRYEYWKRTEFNIDQWQSIFNCCNQNGVKFLCTPFSVCAAKLCHKLDVEFFKIGSGDAFNNELIDFVLTTKVPIAFSTGLMTIREIDQRINFLKKSRFHFKIFHCVSKYPCPLEETNMPMIDVLQKKNVCEVGLSDHSGTIFPSLLAISKNVEFIEIHTTFDKSMYGPDVSSSVNYDQLSDIAKYKDAYAKMNKIVLNDEKEKTYRNKMRETFGRSLAVRNFVSCGNTIFEDNLTFKKPGGGFKKEDIAKIAGKTAKSDIDPNRILKKGDF